MPSTPVITDRTNGDGRIQHGPRAVASREYVAGGGWAWSQNHLRSLSFAIDDISTDLGDDIYERMLHDPQVESCVEVLKLAILAGGLTITPAVQEGGEGYEQAVEFADFCRRNLEGLARPFLSETLFDMLDALPFGNRVAEQVYEIRTSGPDAGKLCLKALKVKPRRSVAFVVDAYMNVVGLLGLIPGSFSPVTVQALLAPGTDPARIPNLLPRRKFAILTHRPRNGDPRGTSICRPAYNAWWLKMQVWPEYLKYVAQFAGPSLIGYTSERAQTAVQMDALGNPVLDEDDNPTVTTPEQSMLFALQEFRNGTAAVFPFGSKVEPLQMQGEGAPFVVAVELLDRQIAKAVLCQTLATEQAQHQARAAAETHQDVLGMVVGHGKAAAEEMIAGDIFRPLLEYNFGPEALTLCPKVSLGDTESQDFAAVAKAVAALETAGYLDPSQYQELDARLGLPRRSQESVQRRQQLAENPPTPPEPVGDEEEQEAE